MAKTRLNNGMRDCIIKYMVDFFEANNSPEEIDVARIEAVNLVNKIVRERFPEKDMVVLRKYNLTRKDSCVSFATDEETRRFFTIYLQEAKDNLEDVPHREYCREITYSVTLEQAEILEKFENIKQQKEEEFRQKYREYCSFVRACKTVEDITSVIELPQDILDKLGARQTALVAVSEEKKEELKNFFALADKE
jgi:hypothetical protein